MLMSISRENSCACSKLTDDMFKQILINNRIDEILMEY